MASAPRTLTYSRVSTAHHDQSPEAQIHELRHYCEARDWPITHEVVDFGFSGGTDQRPGLKELLTLARARKIDCIVITKFDRLARSLKHLVALLDEFSELGIKFISTHDQIDLSTSAGRLMFHLIGAFAEFERSLVRERTLAGLANAKRKGKILGRPKKRDDEAIIALRAQGRSIREIARALGVSTTAVQRGLIGVTKSPSKTEGADA